MPTYCVDDRHGTPCPQPCLACEGEDCDPDARVSADTPIAAARAAGWSEDYIAGEVAAERMTP